MQIPHHEQPKYQAQFLNMNTDTNEHTTTNGMRSILVNVLFTQMTAEKGFELFGEKAVAAMVKELKQLDDFDAVRPEDATKLTHEQKRNALPAINLIKKKRCGRIKGRTCANGAPHRKFVPREEAKSPTISLEGLIATMIIDAWEERDVATFDVPGAYLHADLPPHKFVLLKLRGRFVDIMCSVNPEYTQHILYEKGTKVLYMRINKALYGMIESALLWYKCYTTVLKDMDFIINPYDRCIANKTINGKQCTIGWYVDDNKLSHVDPEVVTDVLAQIEEKFPGLVTTRGKEHTFLGMDIKYTKDKKVLINLKNHILEAIEAFGEDLGPEVKSPAAKWLFKVNDKARKLSGNKADIFHSITMKLLWISQRGRPDVITPISFLCTRTHCSDVDDWKKPKRALKFLQQTINDTRIIGADNLDELQTYIDSSHAVHVDMRGHTGGAMTMGTGIIHGKGSKQKMNSRSSTETEVIGNSEYLPYPIWFEYFMEAQGRKIKSHLLWQDNEGAERFAKNGRISCTSNSRHISIKYFWVTDRVKQGKIEVKHCPTEKMLADFFTKALQGKLFHKFRAIIMGWKHVSSLWEDDDIDISVHDLPKERVENDDINEKVSVSNQGHIMSYADVVKKNG